MTARYEKAFRIISPLWWKWPVASSHKGWVMRRSHGTLFLRVAWANYCWTNSRDERRHYAHVTPYRGLTHSYTKDITTTTNQMSNTSVSIVLSKYSIILSVEYVIAMIKSLIRYLLVGNIFYLLYPVLRRCIPVYIIYTYVYTYILASKNKLVIPPLPH